MTDTPIAFQSNPGKYNFLGTTQLVNAYAEQLGQDGKAPIGVLPCEGLLEFTENGSAPGRGMIFLPDLGTNGVLYCIHNSSAYKVTYDPDTDTATSVRIGTVPGIDPVQLSRNQNASPEVVVQAEAGTQVIASDSLSYVLDADLPDHVTADYVNGYTIYGVEDRRFFLSTVNSSKLIDPLDFATFEQKAGKLIRVQNSSGELIGFCDSYMEFWRDVGDTDFTFQPIARPANRGLKAKNGVIECNDTLMWPGDDDNIHQLGGGGYDPVVISTHEVARLIQNDTAAEDIIGLAFDREGHKFGYWTGTDWTRGYDARYKVWHSRKSYRQDQWRCRHATKAWGKTLLQDSQSGLIFDLDKDTFDEDGDPLVWQVTSPVLHAFPNGGILDAAHFDLATGYGTLTGQGSDPKVMLETSVDGGNTFSSYRELELGTTGNYAARVTARRLGKFGPKGIVLRLSISDPVVRSLVRTDIEVRTLKR